MNKGRIEMLWGEGEAWEKVIHRNEESYQQAVHNYSHI